MSFFDAVDAAQSEFFADTDLMGGEAVTYCPRNNGAVRSIKAIVVRSINRDVDGVMFSDITLTVRNDSTYGISLSEYDKGGDAVLVAKRKGGTAERLRITGDPIAQDAGMISFKVA